MGSSIVNGSRDTLLTSALPLPVMDEIRDLIGVVGCPDPRQGNEEFWQWSGRENSVLKLARLASKKYDGQEFDVTLPPDNKGDWVFAVFNNGIGIMQKESTYDASRFPSVPECSHIVQYSIITARSTVLEIVMARDEEGEETDITDQYHGRKQNSWEWNENNEHLVAEEGSKHLEHEDDIDALMRNVG